jgi:hypothetical protein
MSVLVSYGWMDGSHRPEMISIFDRDGQEITVRLDEITELIWKLQTAEQESLMERSEPDVSRGTERITVRVSNWSPGVEYVGYSDGVDTHCCEATPSWFVEIPEVNYSGYFHKNDLKVLRREHVERKTEGEQAGRG